MIILDLSNPKTFNQKLNELDKLLRAEATLAKNGFVELSKIIHEMNEVTKERREA